MALATQLKKTLAATMRGWNGSGQCHRASQAVSERLRFGRLEAVETTTRYRFQAIYIGPEDDPLCDPRCGTLTG